MPEAASWVCLLLHKMNTEGWKPDEGAKGLYFLLSASWVEGVPYRLDSER